MLQTNVFWQQMLQNQKLAAIVFSQSTSWELPKTTLNSRMNFRYCNCGQLAYICNGASTQRSDINEKKKKGPWIRRNAATLENFQAVWKQVSKNSNQHIFLNLRCHGFNEKHPSAGDMLWKIWSQSVSEVEASWWALLRREESTPKKDKNTDVMEVTMQHRQCTVQSPMLQSALKIFMLEKVKIFLGTVWGHADNGNEGMKRFHFLWIQAIIPFCQMSKKSAQRKKVWN